MKTTTTEVDERGSGRLLVAEPQGTFSASGGQPQTHERHTAEVVGNCEYWEGARPARKSSRRTNHKGRTIQRVGGGVTNGGGTVRAVGGIEPGSDPWLVANPTTLPRGQSPTYIHTYIHTSPERLALSLEHVDHDDLVDVDARVRVELGHVRACVSSLSS